MKISKRDQSLLFVLLGLVVVLAAYFGVYNHFTSKAEAASAEKANLQPRLEELQGYYSNLPVYQDGIEDISQAVETEIKSFPSDVRSEDMIVYGNELESKLEITVTDMSFSAPSLVSQFSIPKQNESNETELVPYAALSTEMSISVQMSYKQMLDFINYIYNKSKHTTLETITVSYDGETGGLVGSATMTKYFMSDSEYEYDETNVGDYNKGVSNPFGTVTSTN
ncbi:MAG: hypothetical protein EOM14_00455 [Clostridia bacterium]|nr:hypothetical protein [Clostridia bacterium]